jgi:hypothetical protein
MAAPTLPNRLAWTSPVARALAGPTGSSAVSVVTAEAGGDSGKYFPVSSRESALEQGETKRGTPGFGPALPGGIHRSSWQARGTAGTAVPQLALLPVAAGPVGPTGSPAVLVVTAEAGGDSGEYFPVSSRGSALEQGETKRGTLGLGPGPRGSWPEVAGRLPCGHPPDLVPGRRTAGTAVPQLRLLPVATAAVGPIGSPTVAVVTPEAGGDSGEYFPVSSRESATEQGETKRGTPGFGPGPRGSWRSWPQVAGRRSIGPPPDLVPGRGQELCVTRQLV